MCFVCIKTNLGNLIYFKRLYITRRLHSNSNYLPGDTNVLYPKEEIIGFTLERCNLTLLKFNGKVGKHGSDVLDSRRI